MLGPEDPRRQSRIGDRGTASCLTSEGRCRHSNEPLAASRRSRRVTLRSTCGRPSPKQASESNRRMPDFRYQRSSNHPHWRRPGSRLLQSPRFASLNHRASYFQPATGIRLSITQTFRCLVPIDVESDTQYFPPAHPRYVFKGPSRSSA